MKTLMLLTFLSTGAFAQNILDLIQLGETQFDLSFECRNELRPLSATDFQTSIIGDKSTKYGYSVYRSERVYHYTNSEVVASNIMINAQSIILYQKTNPKALKNSLGAGFYVAMEPKSSVEYGRFQTSFTLNPDSRIFDYERYKKVANGIIEELKKRYKIQHCPDLLLLNILMDSNEVDIVYYDSKKNWMSVLSKSSLLNGQTTSSPLKEVQKVETDNIETSSPGEDIRS